MIAGPSSSLGFTVWWRRKAVRAHRRNLSPALGSAIPGIWEEDPLSTRLPCRRMSFPFFGNATDLNSLVVFAKVVEAGSLSEAAHRLRMPVSTVSRRIAELEDQLGVQLLERSTRSLRLTEPGTEVLEHAVRSAELSEAVESIVSNRLSDVSGTFRLSAPPSISDKLLTPLVTAFQASYPDVRVQVLVTDRFADHIAEGVDLVFRLGALEDSSLVARRMLTYRHQLVASPTYLKGCKPPKKPRDLLNHRLLSFSHWKNSRRKWRRRCFPTCQPERRGPRTPQARLAASFQIWESHFRHCSLMRASPPL
jgi:DNA-binding transcriptional LysR family regulator